MPSRPMPEASRTSTALKYTPEPGAPIETLLPFRSATLWILSFMVISWTVSAYRPPRTLKSLLGPSFSKDLIPSQA